MPSNHHQVIREDESYTIVEFCKRIGIGDYALRRYRREGLRIIAIGKKRFVLGKDWLEFLDLKKPSPAGS